jgi:hypothetical protein
MKYSAEQHRKAARYLARRAKVETGPDRNAVLKEAAHRHERQPAWWLAERLGASFGKG